VGRGKNEGGDTWSPFDVIGHLIHGERTDWIPRARLILDHGEAKPFEKFDRLAQFVESKGRTLPSLLDEFAALRRENLRALESLRLSAAYLVDDVLFMRDAADTRGDGTVIGAPWVFSDSQPQDRSSLVALDEQLTRDNVPVKVIAF